MKTNIIINGILYFFILSHLILCIYFSVVKLNATSVLSFSLLIFFLYLKYTLNNNKNSEYRNAFLNRESLKKIKKNRKTIFKF